MPKSVVKVGLKAFEGCNSLFLTTTDDCTYFGNKTNPYLYLIRVDNEATEVVIKDNCRFIYCYAFDGCYALTKVTIPDGVTTIDDSAFSDCSSLISVVIPDSVTTIGECAFWGCESLESIIFGENSQLTNIGSCAFYGCESLTSIRIPNSVTSIGEGAFDCSGLLKHNFDK
jgi:hypothetical protein